MVFDQGWDISGSNPSGYDQIPETNNGQGTGFQSIVDNVVAPANVNKIKVRFSGKGDGGALKSIRWGELAVCPQTNNGIPYIGRHRKIVTDSQILFGHLCMKKNMHRTLREINMLLSHSKRTILSNAVMTCDDAFLSDVFVRQFLFFSKRPKVRA